MDQIAQQAQQISQLLAERCGIKGPTLAAQLAKTRRALPRRLRRDARSVAEAAELAAHPKLGRQIDPAPVLQAADRVIAHLQDIDLARLRMDRLLWTLGKISFVLIVVFVLAVYLAWSRGMI